jgi:trichohyalin
MTPTAPEYGLFDRGPGDSEPATESIRTVVQELEQRDRDQLAKDLARINEQLEQRDELNSDLLEDLHRSHEWYRDQLHTLYRRGRGKQDGERDRIKERIADLERAIRHERREHWQDRQQLERERREVLRDLAALEADRLSEILY